MICLKRIYEEAKKNDGIRILVDRLWPRGESKEKAHLDLWLKDIAPSDELRHWFEHDPKKWQEFKEKYYQELKEKDTIEGHDPEQWRQFQEKYFSKLKKNHKDTVHNLAQLAKHHTVTLLYAAHDEEHNNAVALKEYLEKLRV
jgi:uncharacterized protein YeaO (DUF488 family)